MFGYGDSDVVTTAKVAIFLKSNYANFGEIRTDELLCVVAATVIHNDDFVISSVKTHCLTQGRQTLGQELFSLPTHDNEATAAPICWSIHRHLSFSQQSQHSTEKVGDDNHATDTPIKWSEEGEDNRTVSTSSFKPEIRHHLQPGLRLAVFDLQVDMLRL